MVATGMWFVNVLSWWTKAFLVDPPLRLLGMLLGIFAEWGFTLQTSIDAASFLKYPELSMKFAG